MDSKLLAKELSTLASFTKKTLDRATEFVLLKSENDKLSLSCTDFESYLTCKLPAGSQEGNLALAVECNKFLGILRGCKNSVFLKPEGTRLLVKTESGEFLLPFIAEGEFPETPQMDDECKRFSLAAEDLLSSLKKVKPVMSKEDVGRMKSAIFFESDETGLLKIYSLNYSAFALCTLSLAGDINFFFALSRSEVDKLSNLISDHEKLWFSATSNLLQAEVGSRTLYFRFVETERPNYELPLRKERPSHLSFEAGEAFTALRQLSSLIVGTQFGLFKVYSKEEELFFSLEEGETRGKVRIQYSGQSGFSRSFLFEPWLQILRANTGKVTLSWGDNVNDPVSLQTGNVVYLLVPISEEEKE